MDFDLGKKEVELFLLIGSNLDLEKKKWVLFENQSDFDYRNQGLVWFSRNGNLID